MKTANVIKGHRMEPRPGINKKLVAFIGLLVIVVAVTVGPATFSSNNASHTASSATASHAPGPMSGASSGATATAYKDGKYTAQSSYNTPGGIESVTVNLTLAHGAITDSRVTTTGDNPTGRMYQARFIAGYKSLVTGVNIADLQLAKVSGSSLTPSGFNNAVEQIRIQSKA